jgi:hypothetical protein
METYRCSVKGYPCPVRPPPPLYLTATKLKQPISSFLSLCFDVYPRKKEASGKKSKSKNISLGKTKIRKNRKGNGKRRRSSSFLSLFLFSFLSSLFYLSGRSLLSFFLFF